MTPPASLPTRKLGKDGPEVTAIGFGLMGLSVGYGHGGYVICNLPLLTE